jgi:hypothetical protein
MRFWNDMQSKWGFNDGEAIPEGIREYRTVYLQAVNRLAEQLDSQVRAVAFNRTGLHNFCLILFHWGDDLKDIPAEQYTDHVDIRAAVVEPDAAMQEAIYQAHELGLDQWVVVTVEIDPDLDDFIHDLKPVDESGPLVVTVLGAPQTLYQQAQVEIISPSWLAEHHINAEDNTFTVYTIYYRDEMVTLHSPDGRLITVPANLLRATAIPDTDHPKNPDPSAE